MENIFYDLEVPENSEERSFFKYLYPLTQVSDIPPKKRNTLPLKLLIFLSQIQNILTIEKLYEKAKEFMENNKFEYIIPLKEFEILLKKTNNWLEEIKKLIQKEKDNKIKKEIIKKLEIFTIPEKVDENLLKNFSQEQIKGLKLLREYLKNSDHIDSDLIQNKIFTIAKVDLKIQPRKMFESIYQIILGKKSGPRLGPFLSLLNKNWLLQRLKVV
jgi:lysyl-tRNA synthetase class 1